MIYTIEIIHHIVKGELFGHFPGTISNILTDSRNIIQPESALFIAIKGERHDGHGYIQELYKKGVRAFLVSEIPELSKYPEAGFILVKDSLRAFQHLCKTHREQFKIPVIGITGSNGKTIIKEWLYQLLRTDYYICRNPKSYNSQIGVPLSVWQLHAEHQLGIFEAGISRPGEMQQLEPIIQPSIGIITNIGDAHDEGFHSRDEKVKEKITLFDHCPQLIYCLDYPEIHTQLKSRHCFTWSEKQKAADLYIQRKEQSSHNTIIQGQYKGKTLSVTIPFTDNASIENAIHCWALLLLLDYDASIIASRMLELQPIAMRLEMKQGHHNCILINDAYNSDLGSLTIALDYLNRQTVPHQKCLILSDILQSGKNPGQLYREIAQLIQQKGIKKLIGIGPEISRQQAQFESGSLFFKDTDSFLEALKNRAMEPFQNQLLLLKGARNFGFEKIHSYLQQKSHDTILEINLQHLVHNFNYYRSKLDKGTKIMAMVKASSYGSGSYEIASTLAFHRADYLAVAYTDEGVELRKAGIQLPIMVMNPEISSFDDIIHFRLEPELYNFRILQRFIEHLNSASHQRWPVHIKLDTGMHRLGFEPEHIPALKQLLHSHSEIQVVGIFSHLASADVPEQDDFTRKQITEFRGMAEDLSSHLGIKPLLHLCNSSGILRFPEAHFDMVRVGIGLYGIGSPEEEKNLLPVCALRTQISQIKEIQAQEGIGYSQKGRLKQKGKIATLPIGYADGLSRALSNGKGGFYIHGQFAPIVGNVCMDMCMVDISQIPCQEGEEAILFKDITQLHSLAQQAGTISYEILTSVSTRVKRIYLHE